MRHYLTVNFILLSNFIARGSSFACAELEGWVDGESVDLRCLYFHKQSNFTYPQAKEYCNNRHAHLVEFDNIEQMTFAKNAIPTGGVARLTRKKKVTGFGKCLENLWKSGRGGLLENLIQISIKTSLS